MKIFEIRYPANARGNFVWQSFREPKIEIPWTRFRGESERERWTEADSNVFVEEEDKDLPKANFTRYTSGVIVCDSLAFAETKDILLGAGEIFELQSDDGSQHFLLNPCPLYNCIDETASSLSRFAPTKVFSVTQHVFIRERLPARSIFKTPTLHRTIYVTQGYLPDELEFKTQVERRNLTGLRFLEVWNDEGAPIPIINIFD